MRFVPITKDVSIQYWLEFVGEAADKVRGIEAELRPCVADVHYEPERVVGGKPLQATTRLYLYGFQTCDLKRGFEFSPSIDFARVLPADLLVKIGVQEDFCKLQLRRENGTRIVCFRPSDEQPAFTGFGRTKHGATRPCHQDFSETYVDRKLGTEFTNYKGEKQIWDGFKPLYLKVLPADLSEDSYYLRLTIDWRGDDIFAFVYYSYSGTDIPSELVAYEFSQRSGAVVDPEQEKKNAAALEDLFMRTRRPITDGRPGSNKMDKTH